MTGTYDLKLVILSYLIAVLASHIALSHSRDLRNPNSTSKSLWIFMSGFSLGAGIWSMHFIGMLAFDMKMLVAYDTSLTLFSIIFAIITACFALWIIAGVAVSILRLIGAAILMGSGIALMHYTGMAAMIMPATAQYNLGIVALSILIAISASFAALWVAIYQDKFRFNDSSAIKTAGALMLGLAITGSTIPVWLPSIFPPPGREV